jgi:hypothetical protein
MGRFGCCLIGVTIFAKALDVVIAVISAQCERLNMVGNGRNPDYAPFAALSA